MSTKRFLYLPDTHLKLRNPSNRVNMIKEGIGLLRDLAEVVIPTHKIDGIFHGGDLFDRGESKLPTEEWAEMMYYFDKMDKAVNGNMFLVIGNHEYTYSRHNPTFMITQIIDNKIKEIYKYKDKLDMIKPIWKSPSYVDIGDTRIYLMHWTSTKEYKIKAHPGKRIIGLYHDDLVSFESKEELYHHRIGKGINITDTDIFENVDLAILGHIHTPLTEMRLNNSIGTRVVVPGSLVNNSTAEKHQYVELPIIVLDNDNISVEYARYDLPEYNKSFDEDVVSENKSIYEFSKLMKTTKGVIKEVGIFDEMITKMNNPDLEILIRKSDKELVSEGIKHLSKFLDKE